MIERHRYVFNEALPAPLNPDRLAIFTNGRPDHRTRVVRLWQLLFGAEPSEAEVANALAFWDTQSATLAAKGDKDPSLSAAASLCQVLLASNRFLYIE